MREKAWRYLGWDRTGYLSRGRYRGWYSKALVVGFLPLLFLLASCGGGSGSGGEQGILSVELAFTPGNRQVKVNLVEKGPLVRLLNISSYQLTAIDSADETMRIEGNKLAEGDFSGSILRGLTNDRNYTFALRVFYFPVGSAELSNLSLRVDYAEEANARNDRDANGITIGENRDGDYLADSVDADDDNDGLNDLDTNGTALDECPRGDIGWRSNKTTDNDGDGCRDAGEDGDDDNDNVADDEDLGKYNGRLCRLFADCDNDSILDAEDNCPVIASSNQTDEDGDGAGNLCDLDDDGDGLIEIETAAELDAVRWVLNGSGRRLSEMANLDQTGCGNGADITACNGYELIGDISLAAYAGGEGWAPLGRDTNSSANNCQGTPFNGTFDGNGWTVRELNISRSEEDCIGLFGHLAAGTVIRNLTVRADSVIGRNYLGGLVGWGGRAEIVSSSAVAGTVSGSNTVGGLVGFGDEAEIVLSSAVAGTVNGSNTVGGLVGWGDDAEIVSSSAVAGTVNGSNTVGGLVGSGDSAEIVSSSAVAGTVSGSNTVGGLVGWGQDAEIVSSSAVAGAVTGGVNLGGLVGWGKNAELLSSSAVAGTVNGGVNLGGLVGWGDDAEIVSSSAVAGTVSGDDSVGGLVGSGDSAEIVSSSAVAGTVSGDDSVGGLVGFGNDAEIVSSSAVAGAVSGSNTVGGLVGWGDDAEIVSSSAVAGTVSGGGNLGGLVGRGGAADFSYWNTTVAVGGNDVGTEKTLAELRMPTNDNAYDASSIYANWTRGADIDDTAGVEDITIYCDEDNSGAIETAERRDGSGSGEDNRIWDFGGTNDYPAIRCLPLSLAAQRSWWFINSTGHPNVNQDRLDALTSP